VIAVEQKTLGKVQIGIGIIAIIFWVINFVATGILLNHWYVGTDSSVLLLLGIYALVTGNYNLKG
jgi:hypothetical protein